MHTIVVLLALFAFVFALEVSYDERAVLFDGTRQLLIGGSIHYPRSTPQMWPSLIEKAKSNGINTISTYVFWDMHEPEQGIFDFTGRKDLIQFLDAVSNQGLFVHMRIGPYACGEWNLGGFPYWLREIPGIEFRMDNEPFKYHMEKWFNFIVQMLFDNKMFASQGGPIILSQVENEYGNIEWAYGSSGRRYIHWAAELALNTSQVDTPWIMCVQKGIDNPIIETCNGFYCDGFKPKQGTPKMWTENWPGWFQKWGESVPYRPVEDVAFAVARFYAKSGAFMNYYMFHGGTNFERTAASDLVTSYDYQVHIDEYGLVREPMFTHMANLHILLLDHQDVILAQDKGPSMKTLAFGVESHIYQRNSSRVVFVSNINLFETSITFESMHLKLPAWSVSILVQKEGSELEKVYNSASISASPSIVSFAEPLHRIESQIAVDRPLIKSKREPIGVTMKDPVVLGTPSEVLSLTKDKTDYLWYSTEFNSIPKGTLCFKEVSDTIQVFLGETSLGFSKDSNPCFETFNVNSAVNLTMLVSVLGLANFGPHYEHISKGIKGDISLNGKSIRNRQWIHQIGLVGESEQFYLKDENWNDQVEENQPMMWYKMTFEKPSGDLPLAVDLGGMSKGFVWVNGFNLGRMFPLMKANGTCIPCVYEGTYLPMKCTTGCGEASQRYYHIPPDALIEGMNELVVFEEIGGQASTIAVVQRQSGVVCSSLSNFGNNEMQLNCGNGKVFTSIDFASFGNPSGGCLGYRKGSCDAVGALKVVSDECLGKQSCSIKVSTDTFGDPCAFSLKTLSVQAHCGSPTTI